MIKYGIDAMTQGDDETVLLTVGKDMDAPAPKCDLFINSAYFVPID